MVFTGNGIFMAAIVLNVSTFINKVYGNVKSQEIKLYFQMYTMSCNKHLEFQYGFRYKFTPGVNKGILRD
jgi:hypothetical protein